jgi:hypothetical protein
MRLLRSCRAAGGPLCDVATRHREQARHRDANAPGPGLTGAEAGATRQWGRGMSAIAVGSGEPRPRACAVSEPCPIGTEPGPVQCSRWGRGRPPCPGGLFMEVGNSLCELAHYARYRRGAGPPKYSVPRHHRAKAGAKGLEAGDMLPVSVARRWT